jgi:hypothetical protein
MRSASFSIDVHALGRAATERFREISAHAFAAAERYLPHSDAGRPRSPLRARPRIGLIAPLWL